MLAPLVPVVLTAYVVVRAWRLLRDFLGRDV